VKINFEQLSGSLGEKLSRELPGLQAQLSMATLRRLEKLQAMKIPADASIAAVMVLFYKNGKEIELVLIKRAHDGGVHSGQIAFPGGRKEENDTDIIETALRETCEETGIQKDQVNILGKLSDIYIPPSNFHVTPVVGYLNTRPQFRPDPKEVEEVLRVSLSDILDEKAVQLKSLEIMGTRIDVPCYYVDGHIIWGATAMIISELLEVIRS
jgi:8-oxo-dGTP pyrophosphatase MutT (NUDIX family)